MKIKCQACGKRYDTDTDELCPHCGSYNPLKRNGASQIQEQSWHERAKEHEKKASFEDAPSKDTLPSKEPSRSEDSTSRYASSKSSEGQRQGGCLKNFILIIVWLALLMLLTGPVAKIIFNQIKEKNYQESAQMEESSIAPGELVMIDGEPFGAGRCASLPLESEQTDLLLEAGYEPAPGTQLTAVELLGDAYNADYYLKVDNVVYREVYSWEVCQLAAGQMELPENAPLALFLTPIGSENYELCVRETEKMRFASDRRVTVLTRIPLQAEEVQE